MADNRLLPIKVVFRRSEDDRPPRPIVPKAEVLRPVTQQMRESFAEQVSRVRSYFTQSFALWPAVPAIARVELISDAYAKSHRPDFLFNKDSCPIVGGDGLGQLYVSATDGGLAELQNRILYGKHKLAEPSISTLEMIRPYTEQDALQGQTIDDITAFVSEGGGSSLKFRLFRHRQAKTPAVRGAFIALAESLGIKNVEPLDYTPSASIYRLRDVPVEAIIPLSRFIGTQSLSPFPKYRLVRTASNPLGSCSRVDFPRPDSKKEYGLVGMIDSGTDPNNPHLQAWVSSRNEYVPASMQDNDHGSFVAGLLVHSRHLNHDDERFPLASSRIVDVVAFDRSGMISEDDLRQVIEDCCVQFPDVKVWNLSIATVGAPCRDQEFSDFAAFLDEMSQRHGVLFVLAAGNTEKDSHLRDWPPTSSITEDDRICPPSEAVRALTVGSLAHRETANTKVKSEEPSPFSRRGPGSAFLIKPELVHYGGNCDSQGGYFQSGVISLDGNGHVAENVGTSFAAPLVSTIASNVWRELRAENQEPLAPMVKGLLIHAAHIRNGATDPELMKYVGVGVPPDVPHIVNCTQDVATIIMEIPVQSSPKFVRRPFPMPKCLVGERGLHADIIMTLIYDPPLDRRFNVEYCRTNVTASLGMVKENEDDEEDYAGEIYPVPRNITQGREKHLVQNGFKWSPVKFYFRPFKRKQLTGGEWQLKLNLLNRAEFQKKSDQQSMLFLTMRDPRAQGLLYTELVTEMNRLNWGAQDLKVRSRQRARH